MIRSPLLSFQVFLDWSDGLGCSDLAAGDFGDAERVVDLQRVCGALRDRLAEIVGREHVRDALFVASPELDASLEHWLRAPDTLRGHKIERALVRYVSRMTGRATPFGLFSGVSVGHIGDRTRLDLAGSSAYRRHTRLDNDYLFALTDALGKLPAVRARLSYVPNDSLFHAAGRLRYAEAALDGKVRSYRLITVEPTEYLSQTLDRARAGATLDQLAAALVADDPDIEREEADDFVHELVDSQLLVSRLTPAVTGVSPALGIVDVLRGGQAPDAETAPDSPGGAADVLSRAIEDIAAIDRAGVGAQPDAYRAVADRLSALPVPVELSRLFQVDMVKPVTDVTLSQAVVDHIAQGIQVLRRLTPPPGRDSLAEFRSRFRDRYEDREVPLLDVLDEEVGIGFETSNAPSADVSPLLAGLSFPAGNRASGMEWRPEHAYLLRRVHDALRASDTELALTARDIDRLANEPDAPLPGALSIMATIAAASPEALDAGEFRLCMDSANGPSGARLLGRFCHAADEVHRAVLDHVQAEQALRPDAVFAEVVHLNEGRIGNIVCRPVLRDYEIPFLGLSGAPADRQIPLSDLTISLVRDRVVLRSRRLDREIIPRLTTAHNYRLNSIGPYRFLCELQRQGVRSCYWSWGPLASLPRLPRVTHGRVVLARAQWLLDEDALRRLSRATKLPKRVAEGSGELDAYRARMFRAVQALRRDYELPRLIAVADGDNELVIDLDNPLACDSFAHLVRSRTSAQICEIFPPPDELVATGPEGRFVSQIVVSFISRDAASGQSGETVAPRRGPEGSAETLAPRRGPEKAAIRRAFTPGSEWLYAKLYLGESSADTVLSDGIGPLCADLLARDEAGIDAWFFIRYADPDKHVRVRWRGEPDRLRSEVAPALHELATELWGDGITWRVVLDTYEREIERYGGPRGIELAEQWFWCDSEAVIAILQSLSGDSGLDIRWRLALVGADRLLDDFGLDLTAKHALMARARDSFEREFRVSTPFRKQVGARFRRERSDLIALLDPALSLPADHPLAPGLAALAERSSRSAPIAAELRAREARGELSEPIERFIWSYIHMYINRLLRSAHRAQELVIYDFLRRIYQSALARSRGS